jgi:hypothetical protein
MKIAVDKNIRLMVLYKKLIALLLFQIHPYL